MGPGHALEALFSSRAHEGSMGFGVPRDQDVLLTQRGLMAEHRDRLSPRPHTVDWGTILLLASLLVFMVLLSFFL